MGCDGSSPGVDPFALLGVTDDETDLEKVTSAFRSLVLLVHPDKGGSATDLKVVTCAYGFVKRTIQDRANAGTDFEEYCRSWVNAGADERVQEETASAFDNEGFEATEDMPIYLGPEGPEVGEAVSMAAGRGGHLGYTSEAIPMEPCQELIQFDAAMTRASTRGTGLHLYDYAQAYAPPPEPPAPDPEDDDLSATRVAFYKALEERRIDYISDAVPLPVPDFL